MPVSLVTPAQAGVHVGEQWRTSTTGDDMDASLRWQDGVIQ